MSAEATLGVTGPVPVIDLRREHPRLAAHRHFHSYVRENAEALIPAGEAADGIDMSCVVLVDEAAGLAEHTAAFALVLGSSAVRKVVCVALGMADPDQRTAVVLPSVLNSESVAVLWAGDPIGIPWRIGRGAASVVQTARPPAGGDPPALLDLLDALRVREVFLQVVAEAQRVDTPVTAPAVRILSSRLDEAVLAAAERRALLAVATGGEAAEPGVARMSGPDAADDLRAVEQAFPAGPAARPGGSVRTARAAAAAAVAEVHTTLTAAGRWWSVFNPLAGGNVPRLAAAGADAVARYRTELAELFQALDNSRDEQRRAALVARGITLPPAPAFRAAVVDDLRRLVHNSLNERQGLQRTVKLLGGLGAKLLPMGSAARVPALDQAVAGIVGPTRMPGGFGSPVVPVLTVLAPLPAAVAPLPAWYACPAAVLFLVLGAVAVRLKRRRLGLVRPETLRDVVTVLAVALLTGGGAALCTAVPVRTGASTGVALALAGLVLAAATPVLWWQLLIRRWTRELAGDTLRPALDQVNRLWDDTTGEWVVADARRRASDTVRSTAAGLDKIRATFTTRAGTLTPESDGVSRARSGGSAASGAMCHDLVTLVDLSLEDRWPEARAGELDGLPDRADGRALDLLGEYEKHLRSRGVEEPPPGWPARRDTPQPPWWDSKARGAVFATGGPVQLLCSDDQMPLLSRDLRRTATVRFAPRAARSALTDHDGADPVGESVAGVLVWTSTGLAAGLIHLVPLRAGVRHVQTESAAGPDTLRPSGGSPR